ncbi:MAG: hypothetical protein ACTTJC_01630 [Campylobacter sp.]
MILDTILHEDSVLSNIVNNATEENQKQIWSYIKIPIISNGASILLTLLA